MMIALILSMPWQTTFAQAGTPSDLISTVNALRQSQGLAPYTVDGYLMGFAQSHSDYMASLGTWTHTRADGSTAFDYGIKENVAMGTNMSVSYCVYNVWSDWTHWQTMVGYAQGKVGAGVTIKDGYIYYTLNVRPEAEQEDTNQSSSDDELEVSSAPQQQATPIQILPILTATPDENGIIIHTVKYGESLWSISQAYEVPIDQILTNSGLSLTTTTVYEGQKLVIHTAVEQSPTPRSTPTARPTLPTPTPTKVKPTNTPFPTRTPSPTNTPTQPPTFVEMTFGNTRNVALGLILISGLGLILLIYLGFIKKS
jgi:LysM repeat protein